uniref:Uncharacterized protein n=1 Tax=Megaviridae environmental sample TaxID=1737588 RepID=A0A5J6VK46_9VIRU|nr:MAG: hypothetical protein [Megaviridae environmental sample]
MEDLDNLLMSNDEIKLDNKEHFEIMLVKPNDISNLNWQDPLYLNKIVDSDFCSIEKMDPSTFMENMAAYLNVNNYKYSDIDVQIIGEDKTHLYEALYINLEETKENSNYFGTLLNINGKKIYGNLIILKTYLELTTDDMRYVNVTKNDVINLMHNRANTKVVLYHEGEYEQVEILGEIKTFAESFFSDDIYKIKKKELAFLKHNINIWYLEDIYGEKDVLGNLLDKNIVIDKCIIFTMNTDSYRGNIELEEFKKIKHLSNILKNFNCDPKFSDEKKDNLGRNVIYTKHRILEQTYINNS